MSDCAFPSPMTLQCQMTLLARTILSICFPKVCTLKFFTLLSSIRTSSPGLCPQGASVYPGREIHRQPTNQWSECPALGGNTGEEASCPGRIRTPFTDEILTTEFIPQKMCQKEMGKTLESTLTQIYRHTRWFSWLLEMTSNMGIRKIKKDVRCWKKGRYN